MAYTEDFSRDLDQSISEGITGYTARVAIGANSTDDDVFVTLESDPEPKERIRVDWRSKVAINGEGGAIEAFPGEGDKGVLIFTDESRPWLLW